MKRADGCTSIGPHCVALWGPANQTPGGLELVTRVAFGDQAVELALEPLGEAGSREAHVDMSNLAVTPDDE